jgi:glyoxylase-like metal-dependent hydrolase (beta-lactamase superfamily II)
MWKYKILPAGFFYVDGGVMFGSTPKRTWSKKYHCSEENLCCLSMNCVLVWNDERVILLDAGVGSWAVEELRGYNFRGTMDVAALVGNCGFKPEDVTDVVLSHLHFDHCGGCTVRLENKESRPTFPNAAHWVSRQQWENYLNPHQLERPSYMQSNMLPIEEAGLLKLVEDERFLLAPDFKLRMYGGHTVGQLVSSFASVDGHRIFAGDVIAMRMHFWPACLSAYDLDPIAAYEACKQIRKEMRVHKSMLLLYHEPQHRTVSF